MKIKNIEKQVESSVVGMYTEHPSPSMRDKIEFASKRMKLRLFSCGVIKEDYFEKKILDAGCGTGEYSCWFAHQGGKVTGIDLSIASLLEAQKYAAEIGLKNVDFEKRSVLQTGYPDSTFDFIYCTGVLHHINDPFKGLKELSRVLKPNGKILVSFYNRYGFFSRMARRQTARLFGGDDLDQRVRWGSRLFPLTARRLLKGNRNDPKSALYDYFAIPYESMHSVGQVLKWFDHLELQYVGSFAPLYPLDYLSLFSSKEYSSVEKEFQSSIGKIFGSFRILRSCRRKRPQTVSQIIVQMIWLLYGINIFCVCGKKREI